MRSKLHARRILRYFPTVLTVLRKTLLVSILFAPTALITVHLQDRGRQQTEANDPLAVIRSYLKATYARDYRAAEGDHQADQQRATADKQLLRKDIEQDGDEHAAADDAGGDRRPGAVRHRAALDLRQEGEVGQLVVEQEAAHHQPGAEQIAGGRQRRSRTSARGRTDR